MKRFLICLILVVSCTTASANWYGDGSDDVISLGDVTDFTPSGLAITVTALIKISYNRETLNVGKNIIGYNATAVNNGWIFIYYLYDADNWSIELIKRGVVNLKAGNLNPFSSGTWYFVAAAMNSTGVKYYKIDMAGNIVTSTVANTDAFDVDPTLDLAQIGVTSGKVEMKNVAVWIGATLTDEEIYRIGLSKNKYMPLQIQPAYLKAFYPMDDGDDGSSANGETVKDIKNGNNGTSTGGTWYAENILSYP